MDESALLSSSEAILNEAPAERPSHGSDHDETPGPSPFLPGTVVHYAIDSTSLGLFKRCARLYQSPIIDRWHTRGESLDLRFGLEFHQAMQDYAKSRAAGITHDDSVFDVINELGFRVDEWRP